MSTSEPRAFDARATEAWLRRAPIEAPWLHREVARRMAERLSLVRRTPATVLDWWSSLAGSSDLLRAQYPHARLIAVEAPARAERLERERAATRMPWWSPVRWRREPGASPLDEAGSATVGAQLLWANMVLHWAPDPPALLQQWHRALAVGGFAMFSCLGPDTVRELRTLYQRAGWGPAGAQFVDMHDIGDMLVHAGFDDPVMDMERLELSWDDAPRCLAELRTLGRNTHPDRAAGLRTPRWRRALEAALAGSGRPTLTFEIVYGHAFKGLPRARAGAQTSVSLGDMRAMVRGSRPR